MPAKKIDRVLDALEETFGPVRVPKKLRAYEMLVRRTCGYPASEANCGKGWDALSAAVGTSPEAILAASRPALTRALRAGGSFPELRAGRLREIASAAQAGADFRDRRTLKKMPTIGDPGADEILLFTRTEAVAAVPSAAPQVPVRLGLGEEQRSYAATYRSVQAALDAALPPTFDARIRAHLLLARHGRDVCKRSRPRCEQCPLTRDCAWFTSS